MKKKISKEIERKESILSLKQKKKKKKKTSFSYYLKHNLWEVSIQAHTLPNLHLWEDKLVWLFSGKHDDIYKLKNKISNSLI